jgi:hypothetical protein
MERERYLATRLDQVWMDQRVAALATDNHIHDAIDASKLFRHSKGDGQVALMVIMAGQPVCDNITLSALLFSSEILCTTTSDLQIRRTR